MASNTSDILQAFALIRAGMNESSPDVTGILDRAESEGRLRRLALSLAALVVSVVETVQGSPPSDEQLDEWEREALERES
jgi:hypothetical protein